MHGFYQWILKKDHSNLYVGNSDLQKVLVFRHSSRDIDRERDSDSDRETEKERDRETHTYTHTYVYAQAYVHEFNTDVDIFSLSFVPNHIYDKLL